MLKTIEIRRSLIAVAASAAIAIPLIAASHSAYAVPGAAGIAYLELSNVKFTWQSNGANVSIGDINIGASAANTGDTQASFDSGASDNHSDSTLISAGGAVDPLRSCVGDCGAAPAENSTTVTTGLANNTFASADSFLSGSTIDIPPGIVAGATAVARADSQLARTEGSSANANVATLTQFSFTVGAGHIGDVLVFNYDFLKELYAEIDPSVAGQTSSVQVGVSWTITIDGNDGVNYLSASPGQLQGTLGAGNLDPGPNHTSLSGVNQSIASAALPAGVVFTLTIRHNANLDAQVSIPEPSALALFAFGLLAVAGFGLRKRKGIKLDS